MAKARKVPGLGPGTRFSDAAAAAVEVRAAEVWEHSEGVLDTGEIENVHAMRVATRRLRATLEVFAPCFPKKEHKALLREVKALAGALGERRDPDVALAALGAAAGALSPAERPGIEGLMEELRAEQEAGNEALAAALADAQKSQLEERLRQLAGMARDDGTPG
jgi:CHAD domain-containing protein